MNPICATAIADPSYRVALEEKGFDVAGTVECDGKVYTHDDIANAFHESYVRHRAEFAIMEGAKRRIKNRSKRQFRRCVALEVGQQFHISWMTIVLALAVLLLTGPLGLVFAIVVCLFEWYFTKDVLDDPQFLTAIQES
jgi:hypothetical protein